MSTMFFSPLNSAVVQTIPAGLLTSKSTGRSFPPTMVPSTSTWSPGRIFCPMAGSSPFTVTRPSSTMRSASLLEQIPASLRYLFKRIPVSSIVIPALRSGFITGFQYNKNVRHCQAGFRECTLSVCHGHSIHGRQKGPGFLRAPYRKGKYD